MQNKISRHGWNENREISSPSFATWLQLIKFALSGYSVCTISKYYQVENRLESGQGRLNVKKSNKYDFSPYYLTSSFTVYVHFSITKILNSEISNGKGGCHTVYIFLFLRVY